MTRFMRISNLQNNKGSEHSEPFVLISVLTVTHIVCKLSKRDGRNFAIFLIAKSFITLTLRYSENSNN